MRKKSERINRFHFLCNRELDFELGRFSAIVQIQEVSMLELIQNQEATKQLIDEYVKRRAQAHQIPLTHIPFSKFEIIVHLSYLIYPYACLDSFLGNFVTEMYFFYGKPEVINGVKCGFHLVDCKRKSYLDKVIETLIINGALTVFPDLYVKVYNYYRLSRNSIVHNKLDDPEIKKAYKQIDKVEALKFIPEWKKALSASGIYELDDLVAFAVFSKRIADELSQRIYMNLDWTNAHYENDEKWKLHIAKTKAKPKADWINNIQKYAMCRYGEQIPVNQIDEVMKKIGLA